MCKKLSNLTVLFTLCIVWVHASPKVYSAPPLNTAEILALVPRGPDLESEEWANYKKLVDLAPAAYDVLGRDLLTVKEYTTAGRIMCIFADSKGDKALPLRYVQRFLAEQKIRPTIGYFPPSGQEILAKIESSQAAWLKEHPGWQESKPPADADFFIAAEEAVLWRQRLKLWIWIIGGVMLAVLLWHRFFRKTRP